MGLFGNPFSHKENSEPELTEKPSKPLPTTAFCPMCGAELTKVPTRKAKCPHCKNDIYVRSKQDLYPSPFLTTEQMEVADALRDIEWRGVTADTFRRDKEALSEKFRQKGYSKGASDSDTLWHIYNGLLLQYAKTSEFESVSWIYGAMAGYLSRHGKDSMKLQVECKRAYLQWIKKYTEESILQQPPPTLVIDVPDSECSACQKLAKKEYSLAQALNEMPLPCLECTNKIDKDWSPFCDCAYVTTGNY